MIKRLLRFIKRYYSDKDYCCPNCGTSSEECSNNGSYGFICINCGEDFETPDV